MFGPDLSPNCIILIINGTARVNLGLEYDQYYSTTGSVYHTSTIVLLVQYIISTPAVVALAAMPYLRALASGSHCHMLYGPRQCAKCSLTKYLVEEGRNK